MSDERSWKALGDLIRTQRNLADMSLRQLAKLTKVSNPYLSQIERGIYKPSAQVLKAIADALHVSAESLYQRVGLMDPVEGSAPIPSVEEAILLDDKLSRAQKEALIRVYRGFLKIT
jgi:transcriptional regulator with XRE-family HTH domain